MKKEKRKVLLVIFVVLFLIFTLIRAQRPCVLTSPNFFYETKTDEGAIFKSVFSRSIVQVVRQDMSGLVTVKEGDKEYQYLVKAGASRGKTSVEFTDLQSESSEPHNYSYDQYTHNLKDDSNVVFYNLPKGFGLESIVQFGMLDTYSAMEGKNISLFFWMFYFVLGFLLILLRKPLGKMDSYIADLFYNLEKPIKPRQWVVTSFAIIGGIFMLVGILGLPRYIL